MKRKAALFLSMVMMVSTMAGCGTQATAEGGVKAAEKEDEIVIWHSADAGIADTLQAQVDALAPNVKVTFERKENMSDALKLAGDDPANAPDMFLWAHDKVGTFAQMDILAPVTDVLTEEDLADVIPMTYDAGEYQGEHYQVPLYYEALMFLYNKDLMEEAPATTDDLLKKMKEETTADSYVFVEQHSTSYNSAAWIQGYGGYLINENKEPGLNLQETKDALEYHKQFVEYMPADGEYNTVTTLFTEGKSASIIAGPWLVPSIKEAGINLGIAPMPTLPNGKPLTPYSGVQGIQVLKHAAADKKDVCREVLNALLDPSTGIALAEAANCAPANSKAYDDAAVAENEMIMQLKAMSNDVIPMSNIPEMDVMWAVTDDLLASINKSGEDVSTSCDAHQAEALEQIEAMQ